MNACARACIGAESHVRPGKSGILGKMGYPTVYSEDKFSVFPRKIEQFNAPRLPITVFLIISV